MTELFSGMFVIYVAFVDNLSFWWNCNWYHSAVQGYAKNEPIMRICIRLLHYGTWFCHHLILWPPWYWMVSELCCHDTFDLINQDWACLFRWWPPESKVHGAQLGPTWVLTAPRWVLCRTHELCYLGPYVVSVSKIICSGVHRFGVQSNNYTWSSISLKGHHHIALVIAAAALICGKGRGLMCNYYTAVRQIENFSLEGET